jgi:hypothetical protein
MTYRVSFRVLNYLPKEVLAHSSDHLSMIMRVGFNRVDFQARRAFPGQKAPEVDLLEETL